MTLSMRFKTLFRNNNAMPGVVVTPPVADRDAVMRAYARLFGTDDGRLVLAHMQSQTMLRAQAAEASDAQIRFAEGQRAFVATIMRMIDAGKSQ